MTILHIVLLKFLLSVSREHKDAFLKDCKNLKNVTHVKKHRLIVGGPSITSPIDRSKGYEFGLVSYHENREALEAYQYCKEHADLSNTYLYPSYLEDIVIFDFPVDSDDEDLCFGL